MKKLLLILNFLFLIFNSFSQSPNWQWARAFAGTNDDRGYSIVTDVNGNIYSTGYFQGICDFDPGTGTYNLTSASGNDVYILKLNNSGNLVWVKQLNGMGYEYGNSITVDIEGNIYITGSFSGTTDFDPGVGIVNLIPQGYHDIFLLKLDSSGDFLWAKGMGGIGWDYGQSITLDNANNVYITGPFADTVDFNPDTTVFTLISAGAADIFVAKFDNAGNFIWAKQLGGSGTDYGLSIALDTSNGNIYTTGFSISGSDYNIFISKLDNYGNLLWTKSINGQGDDRGKGIAVDPLGSGDIYIGGFFEDTVDFDPGPAVFNLISAGWYEPFLMKLDSMGNFIWAKATGGDYTNALAMDITGHPYITGIFNGTADFNPGPGNYNMTSAGNADIFVSKFDSSGNFLWAKAAGGIDGDVSSSITIDGSGHAYITGHFDSSPITFGSTSIVAAGSFGSDIFIAKLDSLITGINERENFESDVSTFPNPFTTQATITFSKEVHSVTFSLYNLLGEKAAETTGINGESFQFNRGNLRSGVYVFEVSEEGNKIYRGKAVVY